MNKTLKNYKFNNLGGSKRKKGGMGKGDKKKKNEGKHNNKNKKNTKTQTNTRLDRTSVSSRCSFFDATNSLLNIGARVFQQVIQPIGWIGQSLVQFFYLFPHLGVGQTLLTTKARHKQSQGLHRSFC